MFLRMGHQAGLLESSFYIKLTDFQGFQRVWMRLVYEEARFYLNIPIELPKWPCPHLFDGGRFPVLSEGHWFLMESYGFFRKAVGLL